MNKHILSAMKKKLIPFFAQRQCLLRLSRRYARTVRLRHSPALRVQANTPQVAEAARFTMSPTLMTAAQALSVTRFQAQTELLYLTLDEQ